MDDRLETSRELMRARCGEPCLRAGRWPPAIASGGRSLPMPLLGLAARRHRRARSAASLLLAVRLFWLTVGARQARGAPRRRRGERPQAQPRRRRFDHPLRAADPAVLGAEPAAPRRRPHPDAAFPACPSSPERFLRFGQWLEPSSAADPQAGARRAVHRRAARSTSSCARSPAATSRPRGAPPAAAPCCASATSPATATRSPASSPSTSALAREVRASRALLDALPIPVWLRGKDGRLTWVNNAYVQRRRGAQPRRGAGAPDRAAWSSASAAPPPRVLARGESYRARIPLIVGGERKHARRDGDAVRGRDRRRRHRRRGAREGAGRARPPDRAYDRTLDRVATAVAIFNRAAAARLLQRGLSQAVAARRGLAEDAPDRRRRARPAARARAAAAGGQLLANGRRRSSPATATARPRTTRGTCRTGARCRSGREALRRRRHLPVRRRDRAAGARSATTTR